METPHPRRWLMLPVVLSALFMYGFDLNVVNVAIPSLQQHLHAGQAALELVVGGYSFTYAAGLVIGGKLGDLLSYRRMFLLGMVSFVIASVLCGVSQTPAELVAARVIQGLAAAAMVPQILALVTSLFSGDERTQALAWFGVVGATSGIFGQVLGGFLISANVLGLGWRVIFFLNLPVGLVVLGFALGLLPRAETARRPGLDPVGIIMVSGALALALLPVIFGRTEGWPPWTWACLSAAAPVMAIALWWEKLFADRGHQPLLDLTLFQSRAFSLGLSVNILFMAAFTSSVFVMSLLLQSGLHLTAFQAGLCFGPMAVAGIAAPFLGRRMIIRAGPSPVLLLGSGCSALAMLLIAVSLRVQGPGIALGWLIGGLALLGFGNTLILPAAIGSTLRGIRPQQAGVASGTLNTTQQFAGTAGLAVIATVFFWVLGPHLDRAHFVLAAERVAWIELALFVVMAALVSAATWLTARAAAKTVAQAAVQPAAGETSTESTAPASQG
jgi:EmrB/QacA subfamily drug resistance transporter